MAKCRIGTAKFFTFLLLLYRTSVDPAGIKAQITQKEEEIDQLRQTVAGLRRRLEELEDDGRERNQAG